MTEWAGKRVPELAQPGRKACERAELMRTHPEPLALGCLTLFLLTAELGHSSRRDSEELCSSLHTCHRKWRKEPPAGGTDEPHQHWGSASPPAPHALSALGTALIGQPDRSRWSGKETCLRAGRETWGPILPCHLLAGWPRSLYQMGTGILPTSQAGIKESNAGPMEAALTAASSQVCGLVAPCPPSVPRAGHLFHSALRPPRPGCSVLFSERKSEWMTREHMQRALGSDQLPVAATPKVPLGFLQNSSLWLGLLSPVCSWSVPHSQGAEDNCACLTRAMWETCLGTDVRAWPSLNSHEEADLPAEATKSKGGALESDRPGLNPSSCLTVGKPLNVEGAQVCEVGQCWPLVTFRCSEKGRGWAGPGSF